MKFRLATPIREVPGCFTQAEIVAHTEDLSTELSNISQPILRHSRAQPTGELKIPPVIFSD